MNNLYNAIYKNYNNGNYNKAIYLFNEYLNIPNIGLDSELIKLYITCLLMVGSKTEARKIIDRYKNFYDEAVLKIKKALEYIKECDYQKALPILEKIQSSYPYYDSVYYHLCLVECRIGNIEKAKNYLEQLSKISRNPNFISNAKNTVDYYDSGKVEYLQYSSFIGLELPLKPGHIIRLKRGASLNLYREKPFLIYKIVEDTVYAFPITFKIRPQHYIIKKVNVDNEPGQIYPEMMKFSKYSVLKICYELKEEEFRISLIDLYYRYARFWNDKGANLEEDVFINDMQKVLKKVNWVIFN